MEIICRKKKCNGCTTCMNICPKNAITMIENDEGFKYPIVDHTKCIDCKLCSKRCPINNEKQNIINNQESYACYIKDDEIRSESSSGGIFTLIAQYILEKNGIVYGAAFDDDFLVKHKKITNKKDLKHLRGSKYLQSNLNDIFKDVKKELEENKYVLFTGTPCQIGGLKSYLNKEYDKLYTQDIICHGVPSPKLWKKNLEIFKDIKKVSFRDKSNGWMNFGMSIISEKKVYNKTHSKDSYMYFFLKNYCLRESCYNCEFKTKERISDFTLGDLWGANELVGEFNDDKGLSLLILNSKKSKELFEKIKQNMEYKKIDLDQAIKYNTAMIKSVDRPQERDTFFKDVDNLTFKQLEKKYIKKEKISKRAYLKVRRGLSKIKRKILNR